MDACDLRVRAYKNGKTMEECKSIAESLIPQFKENIKNNQRILWSEILDVVDHDELIYKLSLKYLRRDGYDIGTVSYTHLRAPRDRTRSRMPSSA